ncbi:type II secretion system ATPase GspE [Candidatus Venteria ishoeyi]|uniref:type II secretion system ATPase GspE n=1 Tax=Candidatus Venteria ishoeyi TaxID=1899563 RepID=UPI0025A66C1D|nr:type II secretion system ATPase GspE [Candidatus Venteria ishoeyi]MDM8546713.1 type II secretion system ATPase GspE [Candidatus Venteria ishoeyi]
MDETARALNLQQTVQDKAVTTEPEIVLAGNLPFGFAKRHGILLLEHQSQSVRLGYRPGVQLQALNEIRRYLGIPLELEEISSHDFDQRLTAQYEASAHPSMQMMEGLDEHLDLFEVAQQLSSEPEDLLESEDDAPIIRLINALLSEAIKENASDIHIEPYETRLVVRFRVDGVLREVLQPKRVLAPLLASRIKVMAKLDIAEKRLPQDGRISLRIAGRAVDVRVSTIPSGQGERVVLRLLDKQAGHLNLDNLGMEDSALTALRGQLQQAHGILLVTGPTGSGKTTSLYAMLNHLNNRQRNIMTVEDPIEYYLDGISQTQVNSKVNMSFARGLRAILRQDPDVVMVGEIRDLETAQIAVQASLTGHLVLSTLHTNTAIGAITRLRDMGIEPFLLASSLIGVMAQRLVRLLCPSCRQAYRADANETEILGLSKEQPQALYAAQGCEQCNQIGYKGRTGIYEFIEIDERLRSMIHDGASQQDMALYAHQQAMPIQQDGVRRVLQGDTSIEELLRVS